MIPAGFDDPRAVLYSKGCTCANCGNTLLVGGVRVCAKTGFAPIVPKHDNCMHWLEVV